MIASTQTNHPLVSGKTEAQTPINVACAHLKKAGLRITQPRIAILTALNISDEFHQFRLKAKEGDPGRIATRANRLVEKLDQILNVVPQGSPNGSGIESSGTLRGA